jgi:hypothetical protein
VRCRVGSRAAQPRRLPFVEGDYLTDGRQGQQGISRSQRPVADLDAAPAESDQERRTTRGEPAEDDDRPRPGEAGVQRAAEDEDSWDGEQPPGERYVQPFAVIGHAVEGSWSGG